MCGIHKRPVAQLKLLIADRTTINILAKYAAEILDIYDEYPMVLSDEGDAQASPKDGNGR